MKILQVCNSDTGGGAANVAMNLHSAFRALGMDSRLLVRFSGTHAAGVSECDVFEGASWFGRIFASLDRIVANSPIRYGRRFLREMLSYAAIPQRAIDKIKGLENWNYPYTYNLLSHWPDWTPDVIQLHNLHQDCFDLRALPSISNKCPVVWTLHDCWGFTGHCGYPMECESWQTGCKKCLYLDRYPKILRDSASLNLARKAAAVHDSKLRIITPSNWLKEMVSASLLSGVAVEVIPNGVSPIYLKHESQKSARAKLGLPNDKLICLFVFSSVNNIYKDFASIQKTISYVNSRASSKVLFIGLGGGAEGIGYGSCLFPGYIKSKEELSHYYAAADVLLHITMADVLPCVIQEAYAVGTPTVATRLGGIPEMISDQHDGFLIEKGDWRGLSALILDFIGNPQLLAKARANIAANRRWGDIIDQAREYLTLYSRL